MLTHDRVVIGASAGGIEALLTLLTHLPAGLAASFFIVLHLSPSRPSWLPTILRRAARLPVQWATENGVITPSTIYVAPPDHHRLLLDDGRLHLGTGLKEQRFRPSINVLFRSAAHSYGHRVIGVLLSGMNADGTDGLQTIEQQGGVAIIQDPWDAVFARMPQSAVAHVKSDYILPVSGMAPVLLSLVASSSASDEEPAEQTESQHQLTLAGDRNVSLPLFRGVMNVASGVRVSVRVFLAFVFRFRRIGRVSRGGWGEGVEVEVAGAAFLARGRGAWTFQWREPFIGGSQDAVGCASGHGWLIMLT